jgi:hypothetical protein
MVAYQITEVAFFRSRSAFGASHGKFEKYGEKWGDHGQWPLRETEEGRWIDRTEFGRGKQETSARVFHMGQIEGNYRQRRQSSQIDPANRVFCNVNQRKSHHRTD